MMRLNRYRILIRGYNSIKREPPIKNEVNLIESFKIWIEERRKIKEDPKYYQNKFLKYVIPYYQGNKKDSKLKIQGFNIETKMNGMKKYFKEEKDDIYLNEIRFEKINNKDSKKEVKHLVMLHGYGASSVWFYKNYKGIIENSFKIDKLIIHGIDMIGFGFSSKVGNKIKESIRFNKELNIQIDKKNKDIIIKKDEIIKYIKRDFKKIKRIEEIYIESLEEWRINNKIEKFDLICHSFGGFIGINYMIKYPNRINKVINISPGGIERSPFSINNPKYQDLINNKEINKGLIKIPIPKYNKNIESYGFLNKRYFKTKLIFKLIWEFKISIFKIIRLIGPIGPLILNKLQINKFLRSGEIQDFKEIQLFFKYIFSYCLKPSKFSEDSIMTIFNSNLVSRDPIIDLLDKDDNYTKIQDINMMFIYGEYDFIYKEGGIEILNKRNNCNDKFRIISNAGHNVYLDQSDKFNYEAVKFLDY